ncbi:DUF296 domain-containing protein [Oricola sp.]|uniref:DUF296 domain-containing protein n=1 Tax=Oricola sp. TaxID=1979950 RepID=UPI003BA98753
MELAACRGREIEVTLASGIPLEEAVAKALAPEALDSAWLEIVDAPVDKLGYVIPALATDDQHAAWYSKAYGFASGRINHLGLIVGRYAGAHFMHGHGLWTGDGEPQAMGHVLPQETVLSEPVHVRGVGLIGAEFDRLPDAETNFELFRVRQTEPQAADHAAVRLLPNQDFATALDNATSQLGWNNARVYGIGSLIGAQFEDGSMLDSLPTEFLVTRAVSGPGGQEPDIAIVGIDGGDIMSGRLSRGQNAVLVTAELVLVKIQ